MQNKIRLEKKLKLEKKKKEDLFRKGRKQSNAKEQKQQEEESKRRLDMEILHQTEEGHTKSLGKKMMSDAASNRPSFNSSCLNLLNNFQGK